MCNKISNIQKNLIRILERLWTHRPMNFVEKDYSFCSFCTFGEPFLLTFECASKKSYLLLKCNHTIKEILQRLKMKKILFRLKRNNRIDGYIVN